MPVRKYYKLYNLITNVMESKKLFQENDMKQENFEKMENEILNEVVGVSKSLIDAFKFHFVYHSVVSEEQEKRTSEAVKNYRNKFWNEALKKAKGNKDKAYEIYIKDSKFI